MIEIKLRQTIWGTWYSSVDLGTEVVGSASSFKRRTDALLFALSDVQGRDEQYALKIVWAPTLVDNADGIHTFSTIFGRNYG